MRIFTSLTTLLAVFAEYNSRLWYFVPRTGFHKTVLGDISHYLLSIDKMCVSRSPMRACAFAFNDLPNLATGAPVKSADTDNNDSQEMSMVAAPLEKQVASPSLNSDTIVLSELSGTEHVSQLISIYTALLEDTLCPFSLIVDASRSDSSPPNESYRCSSRRCKSCHELLSSMFRRYKPCSVADPKLPDLDGTAVDDEDDASCASYDSVEQYGACAPTLLYRPSTATIMEFPTTARDEVSFNRVHTNNSERCPSRFRQS